MVRWCWVNFQCQGVQHVPQVEVEYSTSWWSGGAMVLGKLQVPGRPSNLDYSRGMGLLRLQNVQVGLFSSIISLFFFPLSGRRPDID